MAAGIIRGQRRRRPGAKPAANVTGVVTFMQQDLLLVPQYIFIGFMKFYWGVVTSMLNGQLRR